MNPDGSGGYWSAWKGLTPGRSTVLGDYHGIVRPGTAVQAMSQLGFDMGLRPHGRSDSMAVDLSMCDDATSPIAACSTWRSVRGSGR